MEIAGCPSALQWFRYADCEQNQRIQIPGLIQIPYLLQMRFGVQLEPNLQYLLLYQAGLIDNQGEGSETYCRLRQN